MSFSTCLFAVDVEETLGDYSFCLLAAVPIEVSTCLFFVDVEETLGDKHFVCLHSSKWIFPHDVIAVCLDVSVCLFSLDVEETHVNKHLDADFFYGCFLYVCFSQLKKLVG